MQGSMMSIFSPGYSLFTGLFTGLNEEADARLNDFNIYRSCVLFTGLSEEADARLSSASRKLQGQASQAGCTATGACPIPKVPSPAAADLLSPAESTGAAAEGRAGAPALSSSAPSPAAGPVPAAGNQEQAAQAM